MDYRVGQRVRMLHESGEGVIIRLIDKKTVEVDMGDDFPIDVPVDELILIDQAERRYMGGKVDEEEKQVAEKRSKALKQLGTTLLDVSLVIRPDEGDRYELILVNPEPADMLFTCYRKLGNKYHGQASGQVQSGEYFPLMKLPRVELNQTKAFYFQVLSFVTGQGHPHAPLTTELGWNKSRLNEPPIFITAIKGEGWKFSLRESKQAVDVKKIDKSEFIRVRKADEAKPRKENVEVDLHIEELVSRPHELAPSEMLRIQTEHLHASLAKALEENYGSMVIIHGVGIGVLKKEVHKILKKTPFVKNVEQGDPGKYGNGATRVVFE